MENGKTFYDFPSQFYESEQVSCIDVIRFFIHVRNKLETQEVKKVQMWVSKDVQAKAIAYLAKKIISTVSEVTIKTVASNNSLNKPNVISNLREKLEEFKQNPTEHNLIMIS